MNRKPAAVICSAIGLSLFAQASLAMPSLSRHGMDAIQTRNLPPVTPVAMSASERWHKLFQRHTYTGEPFPYHLRGRFTGDPHMPVRDNRGKLGDSYQCTYFDDGRGRMIVCD